MAARNFSGILQVEIMQEKAGISFIRSTMSYVTLMSECVLIHDDRKWCRANRGPPDKRG